MNSRAHRALARATSTAAGILAGTSVLLVLLAPACASAVATNISPLPASDYHTHAVCPAPAPGHAGCLALALAPSTGDARTRVQTQGHAQAQAQGHAQGITRGTSVGMTTSATACAQAYPACLTPENLNDAYFPGEKPEAVTSQTIALVDSYNDYAAEEDLATYDKEFNLPELKKCTVAQPSDCFEQVNQEGSAEPAKLPFPRTKTELTDRDDICLADIEVAEQDNTGLGLGEAGEQACFEAEEAGGWAIETSTDIEMAHAICQNCKILLVEAGKPSYGSLQEAEETASYLNLGEGDQSAVRKLGATEVSNSWGGSEPDTEEERKLEADGVDAFNYPGTVITAAAGDAGYLNWTDAKEVEEEKQKCLEHAGTPEERSACDEIGYSVGANYPASSPHVVAVGGTKLHLDSAGARESESVWNEDPNPAGGDDGAAGGGCSERFTAPPWQQAVPDWREVGCGSNRAVADIAADADPYTGVAVYDSVPDLRTEENENDEEEIVDTPLEWAPIGGTSVASPIIASMFALAGGANGVSYPAATLYSHLETTSLHDVTSGGNGRCDDDYAACSGSLEPASALYPLDCGEGELICNAAPGCEGRYYDGPTGVGTPDGIGAFRPEKQPAIFPAKCAPTGKASGTEGKEQSGSGNESGGGSGSDGGSGTTQPATSAGGASSAGGGSSSSSGTTGSPSATPIAAGRATVRLTAFALTPTALLALDRPRSKISSIVFAFTLSAAARVRATLAKLVRVHGHNRWVSVPVGALTFSAVKGRNRRRLTSLDALTPGRYRLTLTPQAGSARMLAFQVG